jgi:hypothetical protein
VAMGKMREGESRDKCVVVREGKNLDLIRGEVIFLMDLVLKRSMTCF